MARATDRTRVGHLLAFVGIAASASCNSLIGVGDLQKVACVTICVDPNAADVGMGTNATTATSTGNAGSSATGPTAGAGAATSGSGGAGGSTGTAGGGGNAGSTAGRGAPDGGAEGGAAGGSMGDAGSDGGAILMEELVDDMEDHQLPHLIIARSGRVGYWLTMNDSTPGGTQSPPENNFVMSPGGANNSSLAAHLSGNGFTDWGIFMGFTLNRTQQGPPNSYDASPYRGLSFWARLGPSDACTPDSICHLLRVSIATRDTEQWGAVCSVCRDHFGSWQTLTDTWQKYTVFFADMTQLGFGVPGPSQGLTFDASRAYEVQFRVQPAGRPFDFWIDDVALVLK